MTLTQKICWVAVVAGAAVFLMGCESYPTHDKMLSETDNPTVTRSEELTVNGSKGITGTNHNVEQGRPGTSGVGTAGGM